MCARNMNAHWPIFFSKPNQIKDYQLGMLQVYTCPTRLVRRYDHDAQEIPCSSGSCGRCIIAIKNSSGPESTQFRIEYFRHPFYFALR